MGSLASDILAKACMSFRSRIEAIFTADGSFIKYVDCQHVSLQKNFYFYKIGWFSTVLCHLKERRKKFRIYRCHPVLFGDNQYLLCVCCGTVMIWFRSPGSCSDLGKVSVPVSNPSREPFPNRI